MQQSTLELPGLPPESGPARQLPLALNAPAAAAASDGLPPDRPLAADDGAPEVASYRDSFDDELSPDEDGLRRRIAAASRPARRAPRERPRSG